ncbi:MAG: beta-ketoacyl synthase N-terminal-like domain-containing protein, partial [Acidobacteriota bacterium]
MLELLNRYSHGFASIPLLAALRQAGALDLIATGEPFSAGELTRTLSANRGYLDASLRMLESLGWIRRLPDGGPADGSAGAAERDARFEATPELAREGREGGVECIPDGIMELFGFPFDRYLEGVAGEAGPGLSLEPWMRRSAERWGSSHPFLPDFLDGLLVVPLLLALSRQGRWAVPAERADGEGARLELDLPDRTVRDEVEGLFLDKGWAVRPGPDSSDPEPSNRPLALTRTGRFVVERIPITAALASYRPMLLRADELLFGDPARVFAPEADGAETHLDRALNVLGSGFQHERYFAALSELVIRLFDHDDHDAQPRYIADTGCGDGSLLRRLVETVRDRTRRGRVLDRHPLTAIAVDYNERALEVAARTLDGIDHIALKGDVGDPAGILRELAARGVEDPDRVLHVRSFLDHDRPYREPEDRDEAARRPYREPGRRPSGVYIDADGRPIPPRDMVQSTVEHLRRWAEAVNDHGLILLEVHCLPPAATARFLDESESFHFDLYQALSHQYPLEPEVFLTCAAEAGLFHREGHGRRFPEHLPFTRITLSHFERRPYTVRHVREDDLPELAGLEEAWPQPGARRDPAAVAEEIGRGLRDFPEGQLLLRDDDGALVAAVATERSGSRPTPDRGAGGPVQVTAVRALPGALLEEPAHARARARDLLDFVATYWSLAEPDGRVLGLRDARAALGPDPAGDALPETPRSAVAVARAVGETTRELPFSPEDDPRAGERELGRFSFRWLVAIFQGMGVLREPGETHELGALERRLGVAPKYRRYFDALTRRLAAEGVLLREGDRITAGESIREYAPAAVDEEVAAFERDFPKRHPACAGLMQFTLRCLSRYEEVLTGRVDVADVLFRDGDLDVFADVFHGDAVSDHFNRIVAETVREVVDRAPAGEPVRILEIGAGTGGTTAAVLEALRPVADRVEVCFTDVSQAFLRHAERRFAGSRPRLELRTLDIDADPAAQGLAGRRFDVVVAANVLHDTRDVERTLARTGGLLVPDGLLVLNEYTSVKDCLSFSGALLHGWWLFEDPERRLPDSCLLSVPLWQRALERTGFGLAGAFTLPTQSPSAPDCSQSVMLCPVRDRAEAPAVAAPAGRVEPAARPAPGALGGVLAEAGAGEPADRIGRAVREDLRTILGDDREAAYDPDRPLMEMGLDSIELVELKYHLGRRFELELSSTFLFEHETPAKIAAALESMVPEERLRELEPAGGADPAGGIDPRISGAPEADAGAVAVVGVACRFPGGVTTPEGFWRLLERGEDGIRPLPADRWRWPAAVDVAGTHRGIDRGGFLERIDELDARFFRVAPKEAELMDPQQRMLLELSWEALEDAGHRPSELAGGPVGVFVGVCHGDYRDVLRAASETADAYVGSGSAYSILANRLSYFYDFKGPSLAVDTACSSSLVALHEAVSAIRRGDCEQALVGAANLLCSPTNSLTYHDAGMLSPTGRCRAFDERADGYVRGEGGAALLL